MFSIILYGFISIKLISAISSDWPTGCPEIVSKARWDGRTSMAIDYVIIPAKFVIIHHTVTPGCTSEKDCALVVKGIQDFHMETLEFHDIGYNFLVGGDGKIYEGAGWHKVGAHTIGYNSKSLGLAFIGDFSTKRPSNVQLKAAKNFLRCAIEIGEVAENYKLFGARQLGSTASPGIYLYNEIKTWPNYNRSP